MQLIAEGYHLLKDILGLTPPEMADVFDEWNKGELDSFLVEITANILRFKDAEGAYTLQFDQLLKSWSWSWNCFFASSYELLATSMIHLNFLNLFETRFDFWFVNDRRLFGWENQRHSWSERHGKMDSHFSVGLRHPRHFDRRGRFRTLPVLVAEWENRSVATSCGSDYSTIRRRSRSIHRSHSPGSILYLPKL